jgi:hypothetical protein
MVFEIDFADPHRQVGPLLRALPDVGKPLRNIDVAKRRHRGKIHKLADALQHVLGRAAAAVAPAEQQQTLGIALLVLIVPPGLHRGARTDPAVIPAGRIVVGVHQHPRAIEPLPPEEIRGKLVSLRPVGLVGEEAVEAGES